MCILAICISAGCSNNDWSRNDVADGTAVEIASVFTIPSVKAAIEGDSFTEDEAKCGIGVFLMDGPALYGTNPANARYEYNGTKWTSDQPLRISSKEGTLYACYPFNPDVTSVRTVPVASSINGTDFLYARPQAITSEDAKTTSLVMKHALTRIKVRIKKSASYVSAGSLSSLAIIGEGVASSGSIDITTGEITATGTGFTVSGLNETISAEGIVKDCLIVPAAGSDTPQAIAISLVVDGSTYDITLDGDLAVLLQQGIMTDIALSLTNTGIIVDGLSINKWNEAGSMDTFIKCGICPVTIEFADEEGIDDDVLIVNSIIDNPSASDSNDFSTKSLVVKAVSLSGRKLKCTLSGNADVTRERTGDVHTFTIKDITAAVTATISYAKPITVTCERNVDAYGTIEIEGELFEGEPITIYAKPRTGISIGDIKSSSFTLKELRVIYGSEYYSGNESPQTITPTTDVWVGAFFGKPEILPGLFTVATPNPTFPVSSKIVSFSKGNLWCDTAQAPKTTNFHLEDNQYEYLPYYSGTRHDDHISHFFGCGSSADAAAFKYDYEKEETSFFAEKDFLIGTDTTRWSSLSAKEWNFLVCRKEDGSADNTNTIRQNRYKFGVTVCGISNCLVLIPDQGWDGNFLSPSNFVKKTEYDENTSPKWSAMEAAGAVCIPAAGMRYNDDSFIDSPGSNGCYKPGFSFSPTSDKPANRDIACAVRPVFVLFDITSDYE